jgi:hypothetical protein
MEATNLNPQEVNFSEFNYLPHDKVEITGNLFNLIVQFTRMVQEDNTEINYSAKIKDKEEFFNQEPEVIYNKTAFLALNILDTLFSIHESNVLNGRARTSAEVEAYFSNEGGEVEEKPGVELV